MSSNLLPDPHNAADGHLPSERLAALADETPTVVETRHLASCTSCAGEVDAYQTLLALSREERDRLGQPLTSWPSLADALASADAHSGTSAGLSTLFGRRSAPARRWTAQAAAAVLFLVAGVAAGRYSARGKELPPATAMQVANIQATNEPGARLISDTSGFRSTDDALKELTESESRYRHAIAYLMQADTGESPDGYQARLDALATIEQTMGNALQRVPNDPVLNQGLSWSVAAQQATQHLLQQASLVEKAHRY